MLRNKSDGAVHRTLKSLELEESLPNKILKVVNVDFKLPMLLCVLQYLSPRSSRCHNDLSTTICIDIQISFRKFLN